MFPTDSQVDASRHKFAKPDLAYGLAMGGQTDSQVGSQVHASRKKSWISRLYCWLASTCDQLAPTCVGWPKCEDLTSTCVRIWVRPKSTQVIVIPPQGNASGWPNETQVERKSKTCVEFCGLASPFGQGFREWMHNPLTWIFLSQLLGTSNTTPWKTNKNKQTTTTLTLDCRTHAHRNKTVPQLVSLSYSSKVGDVIACSLFCLSSFFCRRNIHSYDTRQISYRKIPLVNPALIQLLKGPYGILRYWVN